MFLPDTSTKVAVFQQLILEQKSNKLNELNIYRAIE